MSLLMKSKPIQYSLHLVANCLVLAGYGLLFGPAGILQGDFCHGEDSWTSFRNGGANTSQTQHVPLNWSPDSGIAWQVELPGYGQSSPLYWEGVIYVTAVQGAMKEENLILAVDAESGDLRWTYASQSSEQANNYYAKSRAAPTPVVDSSGVYAFFEGGDVIAVNHEGHLMWRRSLTTEYGAFENGHGLGSSLAQSDDSVIVLIDHRGPSYLLSLDKKTGRNNWKVERSSRSSWTSPIVATLGSTEQVIVSSNGTVDGYDLSTGQQLWTVADIGGNTIPSITATPNHVFVGASKSERAVSDIDQSSCCIEVERQGDRFVGQVKWRAEKAQSHYASPLVVDGCVYHVNKVGVVHCLDATTGQPHYMKRSAGMCWATPIAVQGNIFLFAKDGTTTVLKSGQEHEEIAVNQLWDPDSPPKPERYMESPPKPAPGQSLAERIANSDQNEDGRLTKSELPESMQSLFERLDTNRDGTLDSDEIKTVAERSRRSGNSGSYGDPIVYGVAVGNHAFYVRTGTRLYCLSGGH